MQGSLKLNKTVSKVIYWSVEKKTANITLLIIQRKILSALEKSRISLADQSAGQTIISPFRASINDPPLHFFQHCMDFKLNIRIVFPLKAFWIHSRRYLEDE